MLVSPICTHRPTVAFGEYPPIGVYYHRHFWIRTVLRCIQSIPVSPDKGTGVDVGQNLILRQSMSRDASV